MKSYPSIENASKAPRQDCHVFVKYDGSNLRFEYSRKRGWYKFGTRRQMIDHTDPIFGPAVPLFLEKYGDDLEKVFRKEKIFRGVDNYIVFGEWFGAKTFAGMHVPDDPKTVVVFDVNPLKKGMLGPKQFVDTFGHLEIAELLCVAKLGQQLISNVQQGILDCSSKLAIANEMPEGVVCKGGSGHDMWACKIKTQAYRDRLTEVYQDDWAKHWE